MLVWQLGTLQGRHDETMNANICKEDFRFYGPAEWAANSSKQRAPQELCGHPAHLSSPAAAAAVLLHPERLMLCCCSTSGCQVSPKQPQLQRARAAEVVVKTLAACVVVCGLNEGSRKQSQDINTEIRHVVVQTLASGT